MTEMYYKIAYNPKNLHQIIIIYLFFYKLTKLLWMWLKKLNLVASQLKNEMKCWVSGHFCTC